MPRGVYHRIVSPKRITPHKMRFEIECGKRRIINADSPQEAWRKFRKTIAGHQMADMVRFREVPWNAQYAWDKKQGGHARPGQWYYCHPCWFDTPPAAAFGLSSRAPTEKS